MKLLIALFVLLFSVSAYGQHRDRHHDANGMHYGGANPPVGVGGAHCMYSVYGCSGAGGSTNFHGYRNGYIPHGGVVHHPHGGYGYRCGGNYTNRGGNINSYNGQVGGNLYFNRGQSNCNQNGQWNSSQQSGSIGYYNGQVTGNLGFHQSQSN